MTANGQVPNDGDHCKHGTNMRLSSCGLCDREAHSSNERVSTERLTELTASCFFQSETGGHSDAYVAFLCDLASVCMELQSRRAADEPSPQRAFAVASQSAITPDDWSVNWPHSSVGNFSQSEARMWAAHMNEAYAAGSRPVPPRAATVHPDSHLIDSLGVRDMLNEMTRQNDETRRQLRERTGAPETKRAGK